MSMLRILYCVQLKMDLYSIDFGHTGFVSLLRFHGDTALTTRFAWVDEICIHNLVDTDQEHYYCINLGPKFCWSYCSCYSCSFMSLLSTSKLTSSSWATLYQLSCPLLLGERQCDAWYPGKEIQWPVAWKRSMWSVSGLPVACHRLIFWVCNWCLLFPTQHDNAFFFLLAAMECWMFHHVYQSNKRRHKVETISLPLST